MAVTHARRRSPDPHLVQRSAVYLVLLQRDVRHHRHLGRRPRRTDLVRPLSRC